MGKSLNFVKQRIATGECNGMENNKYDTMFECNFLEIIENTYGSFLWKGNTCNFVMDNLEGSTEITIKYDPDADFEYFTMERCINDGTLYFFEDLFFKVINKLYGVQDDRTYNIKKAPSDFLPNPFNYYIKYTVGNFVCSTENFCDFSIGSEPWMRSRFTVMLPIKMEFVRKE